MAIGSANGFARAYWARDVHEAWRTPARSRGELSGARIGGDVCLRHCCEQPAPGIGGNDHQCGRQSDRSRGNGRRKGKHLRVGRFPVPTCEFRRNEN